MDNSPDPPLRSSTPFGSKVEKSGGRRGLGGARYNVNPALIDDRVEVPPRAKRVVSVDRSCIDTTSIFDRDPPRSHLEPRRYGEERRVKRVAATEIMENLKKLQNETEEQLAGGRDTLPPRRYVARQLRYIELLENQLKNVILAEEEEREALEGYRAQRERKKRGGGGGKDEAEKEEDERSCRKRDGAKPGEKWREESVEKHAGRERDSARRVAERERNGSHVEETRAVIAKGRKGVGGEGGRGMQGGSSSVVVNGEAFRRRMYDEYVDKVLEREERKHHKVVKISTHEDIKKCEKSDKGVGVTTDVEREFIEKARDRLNKFGINLDEAEDGEKDGGGEGGGGGEKVGEGEEEGVVKAKCLIDGKEFEDSKKLPKHLQEFLDMPANVDDGESR